MKRTIFIIVISIIAAITVSAQKMKNDNTNSENKMKLPRTFRSRAIVILRRSALWSAARPRHAESVFEKSEVEAVNGKDIYHRLGGWSWAVGGNVAGGAGPYCCASCTQ